LYAWKDEFILFLEGTRNGRSVHITGIHVPEQHNGPSTCESIEKFDPEKWLGIMHSHVNFGAFHSCTDEKGVDNAPISLVISRKSGGGDLNYEICGKVGVDLPCGSAGILKAMVEFGPAVTEPKGWDKPASYTLADAIKSDCTHAYKEMTPESAHCEVRTMVERDFTLHNQINAATKVQVRSYTSWNDKKGGASTSESNSGVEKNWTYNPAEYERDRIDTTAGNSGKISVRNPDGRSSKKELLVVPPELVGKLTEADLQYVKCAHCDEDMFKYEAVIIEKYTLCDWCYNYIRRSARNDADVMEYIEDTIYPLY
jgi:hypothetical protein